MIEPNRTDIGTLHYHLGCLAVRARTGMMSPLSRAGERPAQMYNLRQRAMKLVPGRLGVVHRTAVDCRGGDFTTAGGKSSTSGLVRLRLLHRLCKCGSLDKTAIHEKPRWG